MTESCSTSHSLIVWTQEANRPYRGQTHKVVLVVWWRGMRKCMCVWTGVAVGGTSSYSSAVEEFPWAPLPGATVWPEQAKPAPVSPTWRHTLSHSWSQELPQLLLFRPRSNELDSVLRVKDRNKKRTVRRKLNRSFKRAKRRRWNWMKWRTHKNLHAGMCIDDWSCYLQTLNG